MGDAGEGGGAHDAMERLRAIVLADRDVQARLLATPDRPAFVAAVVDLAAGHGVPVGAADVEAAMAAARRQWLERWV